MGAVAGCASFGTDAGPTPPPSETLPPPQTPDVNARPPETIDGTAIVGVFVSASKGKDDNSGTMGRPVQTLGRAIALAKEHGQRVVACAEEYAESLVVVDAVSMFGNFDCASDNWRSVPNRAIVRSTTSPAVVAKAIHQTTRIEGFVVHGPDFDADAPSAEARTSIGLHVENASALVFADMIIHAGTGGPGRDGDDGATNDDTGTRNGEAASAQGGSNQCPYVSPTLGNACEMGDRHIAGGKGGVSLCAIGIAGGPGGEGGDGKFYRANCNPVPSPTRNSNGQPVAATATTARGGKEYCSTGSILITSRGINGAAGKHGADGANGAWSLTTSGFVLGHGTNGDDGAPGQGGGGGGGSENYILDSACRLGCPTGPFATKYTYSASGGGGGAGGCAGIAGKAGSGGGASIGALVVDSSITFERMKIESAAGGRAGRGTLGGLGTPGGTGGAESNYGGAGGNGGEGGAAGVSGHGAPGPSIALAYHGAKPTLTSAELAPGNAGSGQPALQKGVAGGMKTIPAMVGASLAEQEF